MPVLRRMRHRHKTWTAEIVGDVENPKAAAGFGKLAFEVADVRVVELAQIQFLPLQTIVQIAYESRSTSSRNPCTIASSIVLPAAQPLESA